MQEMKVIHLKGYELTYPPAPGDGRVDRWGATMRPGVEAFDINRASRSRFSGKISVC